MVQDLGGDHGPAMLGQYRLLARLGTGGMAEVFLARIEGAAGFTKYLAIKKMRAELTSHREFIDLFVEEARTASLLSHPNVVQIHELANVDGQYFMIMEYLEGVPVSSVMVRQLRKPDTFDLPFVLGVIEQACEGIHFAHELADDAGNPYNIVHRDVSPPNLFVTTGGVIKLLDFGISKSRNSIVKTLTGQIRGKFSYMSPEQLRGAQLDRRSDVFSLGIVLFELTTGRRLFKRKTRLEVFQAIVKQPIPSPGTVRNGLPDDLVAVIDKALARDREQRFGSARDMGDALREISRPIGGVAHTSDIANTIQDLFERELHAKRCLLTNPSISPPPTEGTHSESTQPTANLRVGTDSNDPPAESGGEYTIPDAFNPDDREFVDTDATTKALASFDDTAVSLVSPADPGMEELSSDSSRKRLDTRDAESDD